MKRRAALYCALAWAGAVSGPALRAQVDYTEPVVYTMSNPAGPNSILMYSRMPGGGLVAAGSVLTGGLGSGTGLGSQGALSLSRSGRWLLAVNAGSNEISVFGTRQVGLDLISKSGSGGQFPISITQYGRYVYVLNAGTPNNITGFTLSNKGVLTPIPNSTRALSAAVTGPAQVAFSGDGDWLVVTEKATNLIDVFPVDSSGVAGTRVTSPSSGMTPFGFAFGNRDRLYVSEAFGGAAGASALSAYMIKGDSTLGVITGSAGTTQTAACWVAIDRSGRYAYTTNTGSRTISTYSIGANGSATLLQAIAATTPTGGPSDAAFGSGNRYLYVLTGGTNSIWTFSLAPDGTLTPQGSVAASATAVGLAAR